MSFPTTASSDFRKVKTIIVSIEDIFNSLDVIKNLFMIIIYTNIQTPEVLNAIISPFPHSSLPRAFSKYCYKVLLLSHQHIPFEPNPEDNVAISRP